MALRRCRNAPVTTHQAWRRQLAKRNQQQRRGKHGGGENKHGMARGGILLCVIVVLFNAL